MTRVSNSDFKLREAQYFLKQARENTANYGPFFFNLSACLTSLVSVIDVLRSEFKPKNKDFKKWFALEKRKLIEAGFRELNQLRVIVVHKAGNLSEMVDKDNWSPLSSGEAQVSITHGWVWQFNNKNEVVFDTCERYLVQLEKLVRYCEDNFKYYEDEKYFGAPDEEDDETDEEMLEDGSTDAPSR
jgi:hypothetical protein